MYFIASAHQALRTLVIHWYKYNRTTVFPRLSPQSWEVHTVQVFFEICVLRQKVQSKFLVHEGCNEGSQQSVVRRICELTRKKLLRPFNGLFSRTSWVSWYQKGKTSLDLNEAKDDGVLGCSGIIWTICKQSAPHSRQITTCYTNNPSLNFLQAGCSS